MRFSNMSIIVAIVYILPRIMPHHSASLVSVTNLKPLGY